MALTPADSEGLRQEHCSAQFTAKEHSWAYLPAFLPAQCVVLCVRMNTVKQMTPVWSLWSHRFRPFDSQFVWGKHTIKCCNFLLQKGRDVTRVVACRQPGTQRWGGHRGVDFGSVPPTLSYAFRVGFPMTQLSPELQLAKSHAHLVCVFFQGLGLFISL